MTNSVESIREVQEAEGEAEKLVAKAKSEKDRTVIEAHDKATRIVAESEENAKAKKSEAIKNLTEELNGRMEKALKDAASDAKSIRSRALSKTARSRITKALTDLILGA